MKFKRFSLAVLIGIFYLVLLATNYVFFSAYTYSYKVSRYGERADFKIIELLRKPGGGHKGYTYIVERDNQTRKIFIKSKLDLKETVRLIISPTDQGRMFLLEKDGNIVSVFNGITGDWLMSTLFIFMHILILKLSWQVFVKTPFEHFNKKTKSQL